MTVSVVSAPADRVDPLPTIRELLEAVRWRELITPIRRLPSSRTFARNVPSKSTPRIPRSPSCEAFVEVVMERTKRITIVESDGARYPAEAAFENNGVYQLGRELGISVLNLSKDELVPAPDARMAGFGMSRTWLGADAFITLPVLKTHATTRSPAR